MKNLVIDLSGISGCIEVKMDKWIKYFYGRNHLPETAVLCAGAVSNETQKRILTSRKILNHTKDVQDYYLIETSNGLRTLVFNILGSSVIIDITYVLSQGGTKEVYFVGFAGTDKDYEVGDYFVPTKVRCLDGLTQYYEPRIKYVDVPDKVYQRVIHLMRDVRCHTGISASVPSVFHDNLEVKLALANEPNIAAIEMEVSSGLYFCKRRGIKCLPLFIISDNKRTDIPDGFERREISLYHALVKILGQ